MTRSEVGELYRERRSARGTQKDRRQKHVTLVAYARLLVFAAGVAVAWFVFETDRVPWPWLLLPIAIFLALMAIHARLMDALGRFERAERYYDWGLARIEDRWMGRGPTGEGYSKAEHPYASDLDIFGKGSLYQLLATTASPWGASMLADWLTEPAPPDVVRARQEAVSELRPMLELRETIASEHEDVSQSIDAEALTRWAAKPPLLVHPAARWIALVLGVATLAVLVSWLASWTGRLPVMAMLLVSGGFAAAFRPRVRTVIADVERPARELAILSSLLERLEREGFAAPHLVSLQEALVSGGEPASKQIRRLARRVDFLDARRNQLFAPVAALLLWGTQFAFALEAWRRSAGPSVPRWLRAVGELDALLALATYGFEHPSDPFPEIEDETILFDAEQIGHPLIPEAQLVRNDIRFGDELRLIVVSGSNMSGKSTLLRAIGVNAVLALSGAPVRARRLVLAPFTVAASIRIQDSLQEGISRFYAEILRLRQVMELAKERSAVLFLLDEILHGTNSHDRRIGAEAVVRSLVARGAVGLITTHDLALSRLAETMGEKATNVHFEDQIEDGKIRFDYIMRPGVVRKSNALELMRSVGLEV